MLLESLRTSHMACSQQMVNRSVLYGDILDVRAHTTRDTRGSSDTHIDSRATTINCTCPSCPLVSLASLTIRARRGYLPLPRV